MRTSLHFLIALFVSVALGQEVPPKPPDTVAATTPTSCMLQGIVLNSATNAPLRKAAVQLVREAVAGDEEAASASTDADGRFLFKDLVPGRYHLLVSHPSFMNARSRRGSRGTASDAIYTLVAGQQIKDIVLRLTPGAVVRGRVVDADGDPVSDSQVRIIPASSTRQRLFAAPSASTDDRGQYRISSVPPGRYYLKASAGPLAGPLIDRLTAPRAQTEGLVYLPTYYPGTLSRDNALVIEVRGGDELLLDVALQKGAVYRLTGTVTDAKGAPVSMGAVVVMQDVSSVRSAEVKEGKFELRLPPGRYTLMALSMDERLAAGEPPTRTYKSIVVPEGGLRGGVALVVGETKGAAAQVSGRMRTDGGTLPPGQRLFVSLQPLASQNDNEAEDEEPQVLFDGARPGGAAVVKPDGTFEMKDVLPGTYELTVGARGRGVEDWYTKAALVNSRNVLDSGIVVAGAPLQIEVVISPAGATLEGEVQDPQQHPAANAFLVLAPDAARARRHSLYQTTRTDQNGRFALRGLEPGQYTAYAFDDIEEGDWFKPDSMAGYKDRGVAVKLQAGEKAAIKLRLADHQAQAVQ